MVSVLGLFERSGIPAESKAAAGWYEQAAERGDATAAFNLAMCHCFGVGGADRDGQKMIRLLEMSSSKVESSSSKFVARMSSLPH